MEDDLTLPANVWREKLAKECVDKCIDELSKIPDQRLVEATYRRVSVKIKIF